MGRPVVDGGQQAVHPVVADAALDADRALRRGRREGDRIEDLRRHVELAEALQAGIGEQRRIGLSFGELAEAGIHLATEDDDVEVRPKAADERLAAQRGRADGRALRQVEKALCRAADEGVADILARQEGREVQALRQLRRHVLGGVHGKVQRAGGKLRLDLLGEQALAADQRQRAVGDAVAGGREHDDLEHVFRQAVRRHQARTGLVGLGERQRAATGADPERFCLHPP